MTDQEILLKVLEKVEALEKGQADIKGDIETIKGDIKTMKDDIEVLKEEAAITRSSVNTLLDWAEEAQVQVKIPLFKKAE